MFIVENQAAVVLLGRAILIFDFMASTFSALKPSLRFMDEAVEEGRRLTRGRSIFSVSCIILFALLFFNLNSLMAFWLSRVLAARGMLCS